MEKIIAVVGATGAQGGSLVSAILNDPEKTYKARALTRNPDSDRAKALRELGAEVVQADLDNFDSMVSALEGAHGVFCVTFFWDHFNPETEMQRAQRMAQAVEDAGVNHVIWSTLEDTRDLVPLDDKRMPTLQGNFKVPHFDTKGASDIHFESIRTPHTLLRTSFFWENFIHFGMAPQKGPEGKLTLTMPIEDVKMPGIAVEDIGKCALSIFKNGPTYYGRTVGIAGEHLSGREMAEVFSDIYGQEVRYVAVPPEVYRSFDFPGAEDLGNMYQFKTEFEDVFRKQRDVRFSRKLNPELKNFRTWLEEHKEEVPMPKVTA